MATTTPKRSTSIELAQFLGVDFASEETEVDVRRSPWAPNMVADVAGRPESRMGYKTIRQFGARLNGIHVYDGVFIWHAGTDYYIGDSTEPACSGGNERSASFAMNGKLYLLDGTRYLVYDPGAGSIADVEGFVPTTVIGRKATGGGTPLEAVNLLTGWRKNSFTTDGTATVFQLDATGLDNETVTVSVGGTIKTGGFTVDHAAGTVTFTEAPPDDNGVDSVVVSFCKTTAGYADRIRKCRICETYGMNNDSRVFVSGNPDFPNQDWHSGLYDPGYFPDTGYTRFGSEQTAIMGYLKQDGGLLVVKEQSSTEVGVFLRSASMQADNTVIFPVKEGVAGTGAISRYAFGTLQGDPLFLSREGVFGLETNAVTDQRSVQLRSWYVNPQLKGEKDLSEAVACVWGRFYMLSVNGSAYLANRELTTPNPTGSYGYEWYWWTDIPARVLCAWRGQLYFGTDDGRVCRFRDPAEEGMAAHSDDGAAIDAMWTTPLLDGGNFMREKTISRKGTGVLAKPFLRSSGEIFFTTDKSLRQLSREYTLDVLDFDDVDFNRFTFNTRDNPKVQISPKKFRKVLQFQMGVRHRKANEGFGILKMMISFTVGNLTRKKQD